MIRLVKIAIIIVGSVVLQISLVARVSIFGSRPDLPLAVIVSLALYKGPLYGELVGFTSGLLGDIFSGGPLGIQAFSKVLIGYFTGFVRSRFYYDNFITQAACGFVATLASKIVTSIHLALFADPGFFHIRIEGFILVAILNSLLVICVFRLVKGFIKFDT